MPAASKQVVNVSIKAGLYNLYGAIIQKIIQNLNRNVNPKFDV